MHEVTLGGCTTTPIGGYLKGLGVLRLIAEQEDSETRGWWDGDTMKLRSRLSEEELIGFFADRYRPTPIMAPWNGKSGFYDKDRRIGIDAILNSTDERFAEYGAAIRSAKALKEVRAGKAEKKEEKLRRASILLKCRNEMPDGCVEWLDAAVGIAADGERAFAPIFGTGGNEGRLDYTNNFMERVSGLLIKPDKKTPVRKLLANALWGTATEALQNAAAGQYDPGRAGGANQGQGIEADVSTNPWDFVLTLEGAVAWASGLYRRQGVRYESILCSPFTVRATRVGYNSAAKKDGSGAEIWAPIWERPARYAEIKALMREGRASVEGRPAQTGMQFAEAASSLGTDRGISGFVRYSLLKRRGDSYVALPTGMFRTGYRSTTDRVREMERLLKTMQPPDSCSNLQMAVEEGMFEALRHGTRERMRAATAALGRLIRRLATTSAEWKWPRNEMKAAEWLQVCGASESAEVRIACALASIWDRDSGSIRDNLTATSKTYAWFGRSFPARAATVLQRRVLTAATEETAGNPCGGSYRLSGSDVTAFIEGSVDDNSIEDLAFAFAGMDWTASRLKGPGSGNFLPIYSVLKLLFLPGMAVIGGENKRLRADPRILNLLSAGLIAEASAVAQQRLRAAGLLPIEANFDGGVAPDRLAAALLLPVHGADKIRFQVTHETENEGQNKEKD